MIFQNAYFSIRLKIDDVHLDFTLQKYVLSCKMLFNAQVRMDVNELIIYMRLITTLKDIGLNIVQHILQRVFAILISFAMELIVHKS